MPRYNFTRDDIIREEEAKALIEASEGWLKSLIAFMYLFGCRISEALRLRREDFKISEKEGLLYVKIPVLKRGEKLGPIEDKHILCVKLDHPFTKYVIKELENVEKGKRVWPYTRQGVWKRLKGLSGAVSPHIFRHSRLTLLAEAEVSPFDLQAWAGWSDVRPASRYVHRSASTAKKLAEKL